jgi:hypothetical protein
VNELSLMVSVLNDSLDRHNATERQESGARAIPSGKSRCEEARQGTLH